MHLRKLTQLGMVISAIILTHSSTGAAYDDPYADLRHDVGMFAGADHVSSGFYVNSNVTEVFKKHQRLKSSLPNTLPRDFDRMISITTSFINNNSTKNNAQRNGLSNKKLATEIVRASFCFGTDPYMVAAKIFIESKFDRKLVSPTGAIGFSQLTGTAIDEVNDQLGNRGSRYAPAGNQETFEDSLDCFAGSGWYNMWEDRTIPRRSTVNNKGSLRSRAKNWIMKDLTRDLAYGQMLLKINLAVSKKNGRSMTEIYKQAFIRYNGDNARHRGRPYKDIYAEKVLGTFKRIDYRGVPQVQERQFFEI